MKDLTPKTTDFSFLIRPLVIVGLFVALVYTVSSAWDDSMAKKHEERRQRAPRSALVSAPVSAPRATPAPASPAPRPALVTAQVSAPVDPCEGEVVCQRPDGTVQPVVDYLAANLKHPDTYQGLGWGKLFVSPSTGYWVVDHQYRAQNDYGQTVTKTRTFALDIYGQVVLAMDKK